MQTITPARYVRLVAWLTVALVGLTALMNRVVDPYLVYGSRPLPKLSAIKSDVHGSLRMWKAHAITRLKPRSLLLGSSRTCFGLDPTHPGFTAQPSFNGCLHFTNIYEVLRYFQHALATAPVERVVIGLDLLMFNGGVSVGTDFLDGRLAASPTGEATPVPRFADDLTALLSLDAAQASLHTIWANLRGRADDVYLESGMREPTHYAAFIRKIGGYRRAFRFAERGFMGAFGTWFPEPCRRYVFTNGDGTSTFDALRQLLRLAHERQVDLRLITSPAHARLFESMRLVGLWDDFEAWKRQLVAANEAVAREVGRPPFPLRDFAVFDPATTEEAVPAEAEPGPMAFYWESSHYTPALGVKVLDRVFATPPVSIPAGGFGATLSSLSLNAHLAAVRAAELRYRTGNADDLHELEQMAAETAAWRAAGRCDGP